MNRLQLEAGLHLAERIEALHKVHAAGLWSRGADYLPEPQKEELNRIFRGYVKKQIDLLESDLERI